MKIRQSTALVLAAVAGTLASTTAVAAPRESVSYTNVGTGDGLNAAGNTTNVATFVGGYAVGKVRLSGTLTSVISGTYSSEARILVTPPSGPTFTIQPFTGTGFTTVTATDFVVTLGTPIANAAGNWSFQFYESFNDGVGPDANWNNITITLDDEVPPPPPPPAAEDLGNVSATPSTSISDTTTLAAGQIKWYKITLTQAINASSFLDIDTIGSTFSDTEVGVYSSAGGLITSDDDDGPGLLTMVSFGAGGSAANGGIGQDGSLAAGVYYIAVGQFNMTFGATGWGVTAAGTGTGDAVLNINAAATTPPTPPTVDEALGALPNGTTSRVDITHAPGQIHWYSFSIADGVDSANSTYLDITTLGSVLTPWDTAGTFVNDTEIGLYTDTGSLVDADDDDGDGFTSLLSYGTGIVGTGQDGLTLAAGTYYLAIGGFNTDFLPAWSVTSTGVGEGALVFSISTNLGAPSCPADFNLDGFVDFFDFDDFVSCFEGGACPPGQDADFNNDNFVDFFDFDDFTLAFETGC